MHPQLESEIDRLSDLDDWRVQAARMRDDGKNALRRNRPAAWYRRPKRSPAAEEEIFALEEASVIQALLCHTRPEEAPDEVMRSLVASLERLLPGSMFDTTQESLPILRAARVMSALVGAPDSAFSRTVMVCYYAVVREMYSADAPDWLMGGARAGEGLSPCAFVTNECIRAVLGFEKALEHTANYIGGIASMLERRHRAALPIDPAEWREVDDRRAALEFLITTEIQKENIALKLASIGEEGVAMFLEKVFDDIATQIDTCHKAFGEALGAVESFRSAETKQWQVADDDSDEAKHAAHELRKRWMRSESAHKIAERAVVDAVEKSRYALQLFSSGRDRGEILRDVEKHFRLAARDTRNIVQPANEYVSRALDRELAAAASGDASWDAAEMLFAAVSYGYITGRWDDERLRRAGIHAAKVISERGRFPTGRPIHVSGRGYSLHVLNSEVIRAFAQLLHHSHSIPLDPEVVKRLMYFMQDTQLTGAKWRGTWTSDETVKPDLPKRWVTASAVLALDRVNRMLDERINREILRNFSVRRPEDISVPTLRGLFYPDFGLASARCPAELRRREPVAVVLERLRAHVSGIRDKRIEPLHSLILYGPPGTGKTTLVESLAKTCRTVLVEVTPSDIMAAGVDSLERRARAVFKALSLLTRVVVVFDEFDPVLLQRRNEETNPSAFSFLTPGMLPKLKALHAAAAKRSVAYVLITNLIGKLDDAAIRSGRFDERLGIYPPDLLSRIGRLYSVVADFSRDPGIERPADFSERFARAIFATASGPMNTLGKRGWFTAPDALSRSENLFNYLFGQIDLPPRLDPEAEPRFTSDKPIAVKELEEFVYVTLWDAAAAAHPLGDGVKTRPPYQAAKAKAEKLLRRGLSEAGKTVKPRRSRPTNVPANA